MISWNCFQPLFHSITVYWHLQPLQDLQNGNDEELHANAIHIGRTHFAVFDARLGVFHIFAFLFVHVFRGLAIQYVDLLFVRDADDDRIR